MRTKVMRLSRRSLALLLSILMLLSSVVFTASAATTESNATGADSYTVYFKDVNNWGSVFVYFGTKWDEEKGASPSDSDNLHQMTYVYGSDNVYKYTFTSASLGDNPENIAFTKAGQEDYEYFYKTQVSYSDNFVYTDNKMFVPTTTSSGTYNECTYYSDGSWMSFNEDPEFFIVGADESETKLTRTGATTYTTSITIEADWTFYIIDKTNGLYYTSNRTYIGNAKQPIAYEGETLSADRITVDVGSNTSDDKTYTFTWDYKLGAMGTEAGNLTINYPSETSGSYTGPAINLRGRTPYLIGANFGGDDISNLNYQLQPIEGQDNYFYCQGLGREVVSGSKFRFHQGAFFIGPSEDAVLTNESSNETIGTFYTNSTTLCVYGQESYYTCDSLPSYWQYVNIVLNCNTGQVLVFETPEKDYDVSNALGELYLEPFTEATSEGETEEVTEDETEEVTEDETEEVTEEETEEETTEETETSTETESTTEPVVTYSLAGYIDGKVDGIETDYDNSNHLFKDTGSYYSYYKTFDQNSYVAIKKSDNSAFYYTDSFEVGPDATFKPQTDTTTYGEKMFVPAGLIVFRLYELDNDTVYLDYDVISYANPKDNPASYEGTPIVSRTNVATSATYTVEGTMDSVSSYQDSNCDRLNDESIFDNTRENDSVWGASAVVEFDLGSVKKLEEFIVYATAISAWDISAPASVVVEYYDSSTSKYVRIGEVTEGSLEAEGTYISSGNYDYDFKGYKYAIALDTPISAQKVRFTITDTTYKACVWLNEIEITAVTETTNFINAADYLTKHTGGDTSYVSQGTQSSNITVGVNNSKALQNLIDTLSAAGGGTVYIPAGEYLFASVGTSTLGGTQRIGEHCIEMKSNVNIIGDGEGDEDGDNGTILRPVGITASGLDMFYFNVYYDSYFATPTFLKNCTFKNFTIEAIDTQLSGDYTSAGKGFMFNLFEDCHWEHVTVRNSCATSFGVDCPINSTMIDCVAIDGGRSASSDSPGGAGFGIGTGYQNAESLLIQDCTSISAGKFGYFFEHQARFGATEAYPATSGSANFVVKNCYASSSMYNYGGIQAYDVQYINCISEKSTQHGFFMNNSKNITLTNCQSANEGTTGSASYVMLMDSTDCAEYNTMNNVFENCISYGSDYAVKLVNSVGDSYGTMGGNVIKNCTFNYPKTAAVYTSGTMSSLSLTGNTTDNRTTNFSASISDANFENTNNSWNEVIEETTTTAANDDDDDDNQEQTTTTEASGLIAYDGNDYTTNAGANSTYLQGLIDTVANNGGGTIVLPAGTYCFGTSSVYSSELPANTNGYYCIKMRSNVSLVGAGDGKTVLMPVGNTNYGKDMFYFDDYSEGDGANYLSYCTFSDFTIDCSQTKLNQDTENPVAGYGFTFTLVKDCHWENISVIEAQAGGFNINCPIDCTVTNCNASDCGDGFTQYHTIRTLACGGFLVGTGYSTDETITFTGCTATNNNIQGFGSQNLERWAAYEFQKKTNAGINFIDCESSYNYYNYCFFRASNNTVDGCSSLSAQRHGYYIADSSNNTVKNSSSKNETDSSFVLYEDSLDDDLVSSGSDGNSYIPDPSATNNNVYTNCTSTGSNYGFKVVMNSTGTEMSNNSITDCYFYNSGTAAGLTSTGENVTMGSLTLTGNIANNNTVQFNANIDDSLFVNTGNTWNDHSVDDDDDDETIRDGLKETTIPYNGSVILYGYSSGILSDGVEYTGNVTYNFYEITGSTHDTSADTYVGTVTNSTGEAVLQVDKIKADSVYYYVAHPASDPTASFVSNYVYVYIIENVYVIEDVDVYFDFDTNTVDEPVIIQTMENDDTTTDITLTKLEGTNIYTGKMDVSYYMDDYGNIYSNFYLYKVTCGDLEVGLNDDDQPDIETLIDTKTVWYKTTGEMEANLGPGPSYVYNDTLELEEDDIPSYQNAYESYETVRVYLTNSYEYKNGLSVRYGTSLDNISSATYYSMKLVDYKNQYDEEYYYYDIPINATYIQFRGDGDSNMGTISPKSDYEFPTVELSTVIDSDTDNAYYIDWNYETSELFYLVKLWKDGDFPASPKVVKYYKHTDTSKGTPTSVMPSEFYSTITVSYKGNELTEGVNQIKDSDGNLLYKVEVVCENYVDYYGNTQSKVVDIIVTGYVTGELNRLNLQLTPHGTLADSYDPTDITVEFFDKDELNNALANALAVINEQTAKARYTAESFTALSNAYYQQLITYRTSFVQSEIDAATATVKNAINNLVPINVAEPSWFDVISYHSVNITVTHNGFGSVTKPVSRGYVQTVDEGNVYTVLYAANDYTAEFEFDLTSIAIDTSVRTPFAYWTSNNAISSTVAELSVNTALVEDTTYTAYFSLDETYPLQIVYNYHEYDTEAAFEDNGNTESFEFIENAGEGLTTYLKDASYTTAIYEVAKAQKDNNFETIVTRLAPVIVNNYFDYELDTSTIKVTEQEYGDVILYVVNVDMVETMQEYSIKLNGNQIMNGLHFQEIVELDASEYDVDTSAGVYWFNMTNISVPISTKDVYTFRVTENIEIGVAPNDDEVSLDLTSSITNAFTEISYTDAGVKKLHQNFYIQNFFDESIAREDEYVGSGVFYFAYNDSSGSPAKSQITDTVLASMGDYALALAEKGARASGANYIDGLKSTGLSYSYIPESADGGEYGTEDYYNNIVRYSSKLCAYNYFFDAIVDYNSSYAKYSYRVYSYFIYKDADGNNQVVLCDKFASAKMYVADSTVQAQ